MISRTIRTQRRQPMAHWPKDTRSTRSPVPAGSFTRADSQPTKKGLVGWEYQYHGNSMFFFFTNYESMIHNDQKNRSMQWSKRNQKKDPCNRGIGVVSSGKSKPETMAFAIKIMGGSGFKPIQWWEYHGVQSVIYEFLWISSRIGKWEMVHGIVHGIVFETW